LPPRHRLYVSSPASLTPVRAAGRCCPDRCPSGVANRTPAAAAREHEPGTGRTELVKVLDQDDQPRVIRCRFAGCSYLSARK
jgi:hypothetical protein